MALESEAAFQSRALEVGISSADLQTLKTGGITATLDMLSVVHISQGMETKMFFLIIWRPFWVQSQLGLMRQTTDGFSLRATH